MYVTNKKNCAFLQPTLTLQFKVVRCDRIFVKLLCDKFHVDNNETIIKAINEMK